MGILEELWTPLKKLRATCNLNFKHLLKYEQEDLPQMHFSVLSAASVSLTNAVMNDLFLGSLMNLESVMGGNMR